MTINTTKLAPPSREGATIRQQWDACLADPPWRGLGAEKHYSTMTLDAITAMAPAIGALMKPDSWLFLWTTVSLENEAKEVMARWGYRYRDRIIWCKSNRFGFGDPKIGIRRSTELLLVGTRGEVKSDFRSQQDWFSSPAGVHSAKPLEQWAIVRRMIGPEARVLELFSRERFPDTRHGFWGDQLESCDVSLLPWGYPVPADFVGHQNRAKDPNLPRTGQTDMPNKE